MDNVEVYKKLQDTVRRLEETTMFNIYFIHCVIDMPPEMQMIGDRIKSATTLEELDKIKSELDHGQDQ